MRHKRAMLHQVRRPREGVSCLAPLSRGLKLPADVTARLPLCVPALTLSGMWTWHGFNVVDGVVALLVIAGFLGGLRRGLSGELVRAIIAVAATAAAILYARPVSEWAISRWALDVRPALIGAFMAVLLGAYVSVTLIRVLLGRLADFTFKGKLERLGGGLCGVARAGAVSALILLLLGLAPNDNLRQLVVDESVAGRFVTQHLRPLYHELSERVPEIRLPDTPERAFGVPETFMEESGITNPSEEVQGYLLPGAPLPGEFESP